MKEIGGYFEFENFDGNEYHSDSFALNCGRAAFLFICNIRNYKKIYLPDFMCDSIKNICERQNICYDIYTVDKNFSPVIDSEIKDDEAVFIVNYYGQLRTEISEFQQRWKNIIFDNSQDFFFSSDKVDCIYTCRKYFGISDGGYAVLDKRKDNRLAESLYDNLPADESFDRVRFILGRFERNASEFYNDSVLNNKLFASEKVKKMSKFTHNILRVIDYENIIRKRTENFSCLHENLGKINRLKNIVIPDGAFMYPFMTENGNELRKKLQSMKIYVPKLWPDIIKKDDKNSVAADYAENIVPLPCDQRYDTDDMKYILEKIQKED